MLAGTLLAFVAGLVTILNPCVLPLVPIVVASAAGKDRFGPAALALGLATSFASFGFLVVAFGFQLGIDERLVRVLAGLLLLLSGMVLLIPPAQAKLSALASPLSNRAAQLLPGAGRGGGSGGQFMVGLLLGLVWAPCVGPSLGAAIAAASEGKNMLSAFLTFAAFGGGVALAIIAFAYGSRQAIGGRAKALQRLARFAKPAFGVALVLVGALVVSGFDRNVEAVGLSLMPDWLVALTSRY